jgi:ADP-ribose pyrophosphatase YjhB (NUDIX family)
VLINGTQLLVERRRHPLITWAVGGTMISGGERVEPG